MNFLHDKQTPVEKSDKQQNKNSTTNNTRINVNRHTITNKNKYKQHVYINRDFEKTKLFAFKSIHQHLRKWTTIQKKFSQSCVKIRCVCKE